MAHENPIQFGPTGGPGPEGGPTPADPAALRPKHLDLKRDTALTITWQDGRESVYPVSHLRRLSPSADARMLRDAMRSNPLTVLPTSTASGEKLTIEDVQLVGNYAITFVFSDGHRTGIYTWPYLRDIDPGNTAKER